LNPLLSCELYHIGESLLAVEFNIHMITLLEQPLTDFWACPDISPQRSLCGSRQESMGQAPLPTDIMTTTVPF